MLVDSHTHLLRLEVSPEEAVREAAEAGIGAVVNIGTDVEDSHRGAELAAVLPNVYSTAGIHPHKAGTHTAADLEALAELSESPGIVALGEVGLDYYRGYSSHEVQKALFEDVISLANDTRLPLVIHSREAFPDTMALLGSARVPVVLHCFEGGEREVHEVRERGYYVGLAGNVTYKNSEPAEEAPRPALSHGPQHRPHSRGGHDGRRRRARGRTGAGLPDRFTRAKSEAGACGRARPRRARHLARGRGRPRQRGRL